MHTCGVPGERLSPRSLPTPRCPSGHLAFLLCIFLINSLSQRQKLWWEAAYFVHFLRGLMWAQHSMLRSPSANIYPDLASSQATTDPPRGCRKRLQILQKLLMTAQGPLACEGPPAPHKSPFSPQASFKTPLVCGKILQDPKALLMSHPFISLLCRYLGQPKNKRTQIFQF